MNLIVSADRNWGIGRENGLLFRAKGDMAHFRKTTTGKIVVMGRRTLESLPGGRPLPDRENIVLTRDPAFRAEGVTVLHDLDALFRTLGEKEDEDVYIIGGEQIYRALLPYCRRAYVTRWDAEADADATIPDLDNQEGWLLLEQSAPHVEGEGDDELSYQICIYIQRTPQQWSSPPDTEKGAGNNE